MLGSFPMNVDAKQRVTLPSEFRREMDKTIVIVPFRGHVNGFTPEGFETWLNGLFNHGDESFNPRSEKDARLRAGLYGNARKIDLDTAGRLALGKLEANTPGALEKLGLTGSVTVVGQGDHFEVWNAEKWAAEMASFEADLDELLFG